ncbi:rhomboid family intramembrane serine protease [Terrimonas sp. NA20]|uniref:Rhomboid family intramembrane serine protease n=1 Tax=Terrimonas ginsenosidimutans TaxID=2908004 RepID=A0ABS9KXQ5_9BACT|nr:rhomboid family intramembrane serine protease [Terrimonas ginsenosidimutans]MCG2617088.1 rhomboid family intramembrane serine protease [Terrimonas ginsenosidimutans]
MQFTLTLIIVIVTCIVSITAFNNQKIIEDLIFYPPAVTRRKQWYRFFSCGLIHADWTHLIFNMLALYMFGGAVESQFVAIFGNSGKAIYLLMYVLALGVCLIPTFVKHKDDYHYRSLGASGAVSAVIFAGLLLAPYSEVGLIFIPFVRIPGFVFAPLYILISIAMERRGRDNINHSAHIFGALFGLAFVIIVGKLVADFDAIAYCIRGIEYYFNK